MFSRGVALCAVFALGGVAQAGVQIQLVPTPDLPEYPPNSVVMVDVNLVQDPGGSDQLLRMVEFDLQDTNLTFLTVELPTTHDRGTGTTIDDIKFWSFSSLNDCVSQASVCSHNYFVDDDMPAGPVDTREKVLSIAYYGLGPDTPNQYQIFLPGTGEAVTVGKLKVTMPAIGGSTQTLNLLGASFNNTNDPNGNRGSRVDFSFDPHIIWRARSASPNNVSGGTLAFTVCNSDPCTPPPDDVVFDSSIPPYTGVGVNSAPLNGTLWRSARNTMRLTFLAALPGAPTAGQITIQELLPAPGCVGAGGFGSDLSANGFTFVLESGNTVLKVRDNDATSDLLHRKWYAIRNTGGWAGVANFEAQFPVQVGDANGDKFVTPTDVGVVNAAAAGVQPDQSRVDINGDGFKTPTDVGLANANQSGFLAKPCGH